MIKIENTVTPSPEQWKAVIMGARNPLNSWGKSDSGSCGDYLTNCEKYVNCHMGYCIGKNDLGLLTRLRNAGTDHRKFMRMITVLTDITAPFYWWKEFDTYKVGTVANSCSTMHKIQGKEFTIDDFSCEHLDAYGVNCLNVVIKLLESNRKNFLATDDKEYWWQMIQLLPTSYNQKRTVLLNYEVLANIYKSRKAHKLDEWHRFCDWIGTLPYSGLITG